MSDRLTVDQLRLIADQLESGEMKVTTSYFRFTPPATTYLELTIEATTRETNVVSNGLDELSVRSLPALKDGNDNKEKE